MENLLKYSYPQLLAVWNNRPEHYGQKTKICGVPFSMFVSILVIYSLIWMLSLVLLIINANKIPTWGLVLGAFALFLPSGGPIVTIVIALLVRKNE